MMPDVAMIDRLGQVDLPVDLVFWRNAQVRVKHRNPLFNPDTGVTPYHMVPDQLHALNLGVLQRFAQELLWAMFWYSVWVDRSQYTQDEWIILNLVAVRAELKVWEQKRARDNPGLKVTVIQKITPGHVGKPTSRCLKLKAAETKAFFFFLHDKLQTAWRGLQQGQLWLQASHHLAALLHLLTDIRGTWKVPEHQERELRVRTYLWHEVA